MVLAGVTDMSETPDKITKAERERCFIIAKNAEARAAEDKIRLAVGGSNILSQLAEERQKAAADIAARIMNGESGDVP